MLFNSIKKANLQRKLSSLYSKFEHAIVNDATSDYSLESVGSEHDKGEVRKGERRIVLTISSSKSTDGEVKDQLDCKSEALSRADSKNNNRYTPPVLAMPSPTPTRAHSVAPKGLSLSRESLDQSETPIVRIRSKKAPQPETTKQGYTQLNDVAVPKGEVVTHASSAATADKTIATFTDRRSTSNGASMRRSTRRSVRTRSRDDIVQYRPPTANKEVSAKSADELSIPQQGRRASFNPLGQEPSRRVTRQRLSMRENRKQTGSSEVNRNCLSSASIGSYADLSVKRKEAPRRSSRRMKPRKSVSFCSDPVKVIETYHGSIYERECKKTTASYASKLTDMKIYKELCKYKVTSMPVNKESIHNMDFRMAHVSGVQRQAQMKVLAKLRIGGGDLVKFTHQQRQSVRRGPSKAMSEHC